jgi:ubiquinol-cytochrome c reductase cytochrome b subunit
VRTALGVMALSFYLILWIAGGNDIIATSFNLSINTLIWSFRIMLFVVPPIAFVITKRICLSLQRRDNDKLLHGYETGRILRLPHGEFIEIHEPISMEEAAMILGKSDVPALALPPVVDEHGVKNPKALTSKMRARLSAWYYSENVPVPTAQELQEARDHQEHALHAAADAGAIESH